ncbi:hypothetical protein Nepgr_030434 [Nepenthes gracilis]|uniref:CMP-sialic acid transporter 2 n=1 Tax=Nepenthes gracilis TaxID=150966 RepID=A0AAD3Y6J6_NEPGR|nr:hypothetical protein Nepgr_030434 [Nepenthes gracilis]
MQERWTRQRQPEDGQRVSRHRKIVNITTRMHSARRNWSRRRTTTSERISERKSSLNELIRVFFASSSFKFDRSCGSREQMKKEVMQCSVCHSMLISPGNKTSSRKYDCHVSKDSSSKRKALSILLVVGDCVLVGLQPILIHMSKVDGKFYFNPISVNFLTEAAGLAIAIIMLLIQSRRQEVGEESLLSLSTFVQAARSNVLLAIIGILYSISNYLKFIMQLYFKPVTVRMLSNLKVLVIVVLSKIIMRRRFSIIQWEALALFLIGIFVNQMHSVSDVMIASGVPVATVAYSITLIFIAAPSLASVFTERALKSQHDTSIYLQNVILCGYRVVFNFLAIVGTAIATGPSSFDILRGHSRATMVLILNNALQGLLSLFFLKYTDSILKKYSSTVATIFTGIASAALFGHTLTMNFILGISIVFISMHQFFSPLSKAKEEQENRKVELMDVQPNLRSKADLYVDSTAGVNEEASHCVSSDGIQPLLPR